MARKKYSSDEEESEDDDFIAKDDEEEDNSAASDASEANDSEESEEDYKPKKKNWQNRRNYSKKPANAATTITQTFPTTNSSFLNIQPMLQPQLFVPTMDNVPLQLPTPPMAYVAPVSADPSFVTSCPLHHKTLVEYISPGGANGGRKGWKCPNSSFRKKCPVFYWNDELTPEKQKILENQLNAPQAAAPTPAFPAAVQTTTAATFSFNIPSQTSAAATFSFDAPVQSAAPTGRGKWGSASMRGKGRGAWNRKNEESEEEKEKMDVDVVTSEKAADASYFQFAQQQKEKQMQERVEEKIQAAAEKQQEQKQVTYAPPSQEMVFSLLLMDMTQSELMLLMSRISNKNSTAQALLKNEIKKLIQEREVVV